MICQDCRNKDHEKCKEANANKTPSSCDCQHRTYQKNVVQTTHQLIVAPITFQNPGS